MSATTDQGPEPITGAAPRRATPVRLIFRSLARHLPVQSLSLAGFVLVYVGILVGLLVFGQPEKSVWQHAAAGPMKWHLLVTGILMTPLWLPTYVTQGVIRRHFAAGASAYLAALAAGYAVLVLLGYGVEYFIYAGADLLDGLTDPYPLRSWMDGLAILARSWLLAAVWIGAGWLIGSGFYRLGARLGTLIAFGAALSVLAAEFVYNTDWIGLSLHAGLGGGAAPPPVAFLVSATAAAATWLATFVLIRDVPIAKVSG